MIKRLLVFAFPVVLGAALLVLFAVIFWSPFSDWIVEIWGEKKERIIEFISLSIVGILVFWGLVKGGRWGAARYKFADVQVKNGGMEKKKTIWRRVKHLGEEGECFGEK